MGGIKPPREGSRSLMGAYGIGLLYVVLGIGSIWLVRFASHLYDVVMEKK